MKAFVRRHFEDFVNNQRPEAIRENRPPTSWITMVRAIERSESPKTNR
jgi:hypothetical protein